MSIVHKITLRNTWSYIQDGLKIDDFKIEVPLSLQKTEHIKSHGKMRAKIAVKQEAL